MATRYAVGSGLWSNTTTVWSDTDGGSPGSFVPVDGDTFVICAGVSVQVDVDQSSWTGLDGTNTIRGGATPGMVYFANGQNGYLKFRSAAILAGTIASNNCGRLLANSDGSWATNTPLQNSNTATLDFQGTTSAAHVHLANLDVKLLATHPTNPYVVLYHNDETDAGFRAGDFDCSTDVSGNYITFDADPPANNSSVMFKALSGSLPNGLSENTVYFVRNRNATDNKCQFGARPGANSDVLTITGATGTALMYVEFSNTDVNDGAYSTFDVLTTDLTSAGNAPWAAGKRVLLVDANMTGTYDQQRGIIDTSYPTSTQVRVVFKSSGGTCDSGQEVAPLLYLVDRNVSILSTVTSNNTSESLFDGSSYGGSTFILDCACINTAAFNNATQTTFYQYFVHSLSSAFTIGGVVCGFNVGINSCSGAFTVSGKIISVSTALSSCAGAFTYSGDIAGCPTGLSSCGGLFTFSGNLIGVSTGISGCNGAYTFSGTAQGCNTALSGGGGGFLATSSSVIKVCNNGIANDSVFTAYGLIDRCSYGVNGNNRLAVFSGTISNCGDTAIYAAYGPVRLYNATLSNNTFDMGTVVEFVAYGSTFTFPTDLTYKHQRSLGRSFRHGDTDNDTRAIFPDGSMTHVTSGYPLGKTYAHKFTFTGTTYPCIFEWEITRPTNGTISIPVYAYNKGTALTEAQRLKWQLIDAGNDPLYGGTALDTFQSANSNANDPANEDAGWESDTLTYTRTDDRVILLRVSATRGSGNAWAYSEVQSGGTTVSGGVYGY